MNTPQELQEMLLHFRNTYEEVYVTEIGDQEYIFRTISPKEHKDIAEFADNEDDAFERICNLAVLWPKIDFRYGKAYLPTMLAPLILEESCFGGNHKELSLLIQYRQKMADFGTQAPVIIATAFPQYRIEEIEQWTKEKIIKYATMAEWQFREIRGISNFSLVSVMDKPEGEDDEEQEEEKPFDIMEHAQELRKKGIDPMFALRELITKPKQPFLDRPIVGGSAQLDGIIGGKDAWKKGALSNGRFAIVQEQVQKLSRRRSRHVSKG